MFEPVGALFSIFIDRKINIGCNSVQVFGGATTRIMRFGIAQVIDKADKAFGQLVGVIGGVEVLLPAFLILTNEFTLSHMLQYKVNFKYKSKFEYSALLQREKARIVRRIQPRLRIRLFI